MFMLLINILANELCSITEICHFDSQKQTGAFLFLSFYFLFLSVVSNITGATFIDSISSSVHSSLTKRNLT